jgi:hypothetical protein
LNRRITVTINDDIEASLRRFQADELTRTNRPVSFSRILNQILKEGIKVSTQNSE